MHPAPGARLGRYTLRRRLGAGGMAEVWEAFDESLHRTVAVKLILPSIAAEHEFNERFKREARVAASLEHPNILSIFDFGAEGDTAFLVTPLLPGGTLKDKLKGPVPLHTALDWLGAIAGALDAAHRHGVLHRDVTPANILFDKDGRPLLCDFGLAKSAHAQSELTMTGAVIGTPAFMSPEQGRGRQLDARSDQYSLAVIAYRFLTGRLPFFSESAVALLHKTLFEEAPPPSRLDPDLPAAVDHVFARVLAKEPDTRFESCTAFVDALRQALGAAPGPSAVRPPGEEPPSARTEWSATSTTPPPEVFTAPTIVETKPTVQQTAPTAQQTAPTVQRTKPTVQQTKPTVVQTGPTVIETPPPRETVASGAAAPASGRWMRVAVLAAIAFAVIAGIALALLWRNRPQPADDVVVAGPSRPSPLPSPAPTPVISAPEPLQPSFGAATSPEAPVPLEPVEMVATPMIPRIVEVPTAPRPTAPRRRTPVPRPAVADSGLGAPPLAGSQPSTGPREASAVEAAPSSHADYTVTVRRGAKINMDPSQTRVFLDGRYIGISDDWDGHGGGALLLFDKDGRHRLRFAYPDRKDMIVDLVVSSSAGEETQDIEHPLEKGTPSGPTGPAGKIPHPDYKTLGPLRFDVRPPDAQVTLDGKVLGPASRYAGEDYVIHAIGVHDVGLSAPGYRPKLVRVVVAPETDDRAVIDEKLKKE